MTWALETIGVALEVEAGQRIAGRQSGFSEVALEAAAAAVSRLVLGQGGEELGRWPSFLVGLRGELGPDGLHARQAQLGEQQLDAASVDGHGCRHGATSRPASAVSGVDVASTAASSS